MSSKLDEIYVQLKLKVSSLWISSLILVNVIIKRETEAYIQKGQFPGQVDTLQ